MEGNARQGDTDGDGDGDGDGGVQPAPYPGRPLNSESLKHVTPLLALSGLGAYAAAVFWQTCFYDEFGLSPDEVGVDHLVAFERATPLALLFFLVFSFAAPLVGGIGAWMSDAVGWRGWVDRRARTRPSLAVALSSLVLAAVSLLLGFGLSLADQQSGPGTGVGPESTPTTGLENLLVELAVVLVIVALARAVCFRVTRGSMFVTNVVSCVVIVVVATVQVGQYVSAAGGQVAEGKQSTSLWLFAVGVQTPQACVLPPPSSGVGAALSPGSQPRAADDPQTVLPVGQRLTLISRSGSTIVLYDAARRRTWFVDAKNVQVQTYASSRAAEIAGCPAAR